MIEWWKTKTVPRVGYCYPYYVAERKTKKEEKKEIDFATQWSSDPKTNIILTFCVAEHRFNDKLGLTDLNDTHFQPDLERSNKEKIENSILKI